jgi:hypothetical protein
LNIIILNFRCRIHILHLFHLLVVLFHLAVGRVFSNDVLHCLLDLVDVLLHILSDKIILDLLVRPASLYLTR